MNEIFDVIIVGAGPAGLTAGIYLGRARLKTLIIEKLITGGLAATTELLENYPGFPDGINGMELGEKMEEQAKRFGVRFVFEEVKDFGKDGDYFNVKTDDNVYFCKSIVIATGSHYKKLNVPGEDKFSGRGISYCATCDAPFFKDRNIVIIGTGNSGLQEGLHLLKFVKKITFIEFLPYITGEKILQERFPKETEFLLNKEVLSFEGEKRLEGVKIKDRKTGEISFVPAEGAFLYVGLLPNTDFLKGKLELDENGFIKTNERCETSLKGVFAIGDVRNSIVKQVATAVGDGALVSRFVQKYIEEKEVK
uniref:FAD-binding protein n=1 Tax=candidate division WOR-3 bacterium TaxID=2052148 RepID=A0A7C4YH03_UNCW3